MTNTEIICTIEEFVDSLCVVTDDDVKVVDSFKDALDDCFYFYDHGDITSSEFFDWLFDEAKKLVEKYPDSYCAKEIFSRLNGEPCNYDNYLL